MSRLTEEKIKQLEGLINKEYTNIDRRYDELGNLCSVVITKRFHTDRQIDRFINI